MELCHELTHIDEKAFEDLWRRVGLSVNWGGLYTTISDDSVRVSQLAFLRNLARDEAYLSEAPTMWDVTFQTAVAQAELEARDYPGAYHKVAFHRPPDGGQAVIETTRPELIAACVALIAHPDDERYADLVGQDGDQPGVRGRAAGGDPRAGRARQGLGSGDVLHLRRPDRRDLVAGAAAAGPGDHRPGRPRSCATSPPGSPTAPGGRSWPARPPSAPAS